MLKVVVDTNVIIDLSKIFKTLKISFKGGKRNDISQIFGMIAREEIQLFVVPKIAQEVRRGSKKDGGNAEEFMNRFCDYITLEGEEKQEAKDLAYDYGNVLVGEFPAIANARNNDSKNIADAMIVAQVAVAEKKTNEKLCYLTQNTKDVFDFESINKINSENGLPKVFIYSKNSFFRYVEKERNKL